MRDEKVVVLSNLPLQALVDQVHSTLDVCSPSFLLAHTIVGCGSVTKYDEMVPGEYVENLISFDQGERQYSLRAVKVVVNGSSCFCCILIPKMLRKDDPAYLLDHLACYAAVFDRSGHLHHVNRPLYRRLGYTAKDAHRITRLTDLSNDFPKPLANSLRDMEENPCHPLREQHFRAKDGELISVRVSVMPYPSDGPERFLLSAEETSRHLARERALEAIITEGADENSLLEKKNSSLINKLELGSCEGEGLVYSSKAFAKVITSIDLVAKTDANVLITGETGTGKELIARTIHDRSLRRDGPMVTVDCSSIPESLIESELFGYRKGAFTGANRDHQGRFKAADSGTIFLDEIGEMPLILQTRLLRVLQEGKFTPVGDNQAHTADFRVIAATNRDLESWVEEGKFRRDLYYRLNVFSIPCPPLRDRKGDVECLTNHFMMHFNKKYGKDINKVGDGPMERLIQYPFPGNVRELENLIERAFIVAEGKTLQNVLPPDLDFVKGSPVLDVFNGQLTEFLSFEDYQRRYIELVLASTEGRVSGPDGAAEILKLNPQTLFSKMKKLGIKR